MVLYVFKIYIHFALKQPLFCFTPDSFVVHSYKLESLEVIHKLFDFVWLLN